MAAIWSQSAFEGPTEAKAYAELIERSGGRVRSIVYASPIDLWYVFASFQEAFQKDEVDRLWPDLATSDR